MEALLREILAEVKAMRRESARAFGCQAGAEAYGDEAGMVGEQGRETQTSEGQEEGYGCGGDFFWRSKIEDSERQEELLGRFLVVAQNIKCVSVDCAFHKMRFGCALKGVYLARGKCPQFLSREEWMKINGKMGAR